ncbi:MAG: PA14 domain-containing protein [Akkermansiaceae bacterium]
MKTILSANALLITLITLGSLWAAPHPGKAPYEQYCGACHAPNGEGIAGGQFPPLAGSQWVGGKPERIIELVLHGIQGPLEVKGKKFNLVMPPHKDSLTDSQIADIISYVRSSWGHKHSAVNSKQIAAMRKATAKRKDMWNAPDLLKKYPLEKAPPIRDLLSYTHLGAFKDLKALRNSKAANVEEEKKGLISLKHAALGKKKADNFGLVWTGWLDVPADGKYTFTFDTDDGGAISINGKELINRDRIGPAGDPSKASVKLKKGRAELKVEFFEYTGEEVVALSWSGPGIKNQALSESKPSRSGGSSKSIPILAPSGEATIYRNFIAGTDPRGIGVGYSEGVNLAFSADSMSLDMLWKGDFMDGGRHWTGRGQGFEGPAGDSIVTVNRGPAFAILDSQTSGWPTAPDPKMKPRFRGYRLNKQQQPSFLYQFGPIQIVDTPIPLADESGFTRTLEIEVPSPGSPDQQLYFRALSGKGLENKSKQDFVFDDALTVSVKSSPLTPFTRNNELLLPIELTPGKHRIILTYTWN